MKFGRCAQVATIEEALKTAIAHHERGELARAEQIYRQILATAPAQADAWHLLGLAAHQLGKNADAVQAISRAIAINGSNSVFHNHLGAAYAALGQFEQSEACFRRALQLNPNDPQVFYNLAALSNLRGEKSAAIDHYRRAVQLQPQFAEAHYNLGNLLVESERWAEAEQTFAAALASKPNHFKALTCLAQVESRLGKHALCEANWRHAIERDPRNAELHFQLGSELQSQGKLAAAVESLRLAVLYEPRHSEAQNNLGCAYRALQQIQQAEQCFRLAIAAMPDSPQAHYNLGGILYELGQLDEAVASHRRALELRPHDLATRNNLGNLLYELGHLDESLVHLEQTLSVDSELPSAHYNRALVWLSQGRMPEGWAEYEWRWRCLDPAPQRLNEPLWDGTPQPDKKLLLQSEQGLGDTIQFIRYLPLVRKLCPQTVVQIQPALLPLLEQSGITGLIPHTAPLPPIDLQMPLASLPWVFGTTLETIPLDIPYLHASTPLIDHWRERLAQYSGLKVGIAWQGSRTYRGDRYRSIPLSSFAPLAQVPGIRLLCLQKGPGVDQMIPLREELEVVDLGSEIDESAGPFMDTAAIMKNLDLVITSDTATAHLAGALGVKVWVALRIGPDWRWLAERQDSPWYPSMRLFRQSVFGHWLPVFEEMANVLKCSKGTL